MDKLNINKEFAKKYDRYRKAEELQKLKDRYGNVEEESSSSSESEDDVGDALKPNLQKQFFNTLASIKRKDPKIYKQDVVFFNEKVDQNSVDNNTEIAVNGSSETAKNSKPLLLRDYERKVILEKHGRYEDDNDDIDDPSHPGSYEGELKQIKKTLSEVTKKFDGEVADDFFTKKEASVQTIEDKVDLAYLDPYWKSPELDEREKFLRDYILQKKYVVTEEAEDDDDDENEDEDDFLNKQEMFEHKYNHRFQEPDRDFIKSYPRNVKTSVRAADSKKKKKRTEKNKLKAEAKVKKTEELKRLKQLKREEIMEKLDRLKQASGEVGVKFSEGDIAEDFDAAKHDERMKELFDNEFYNEPEDVKPDFSDLEDFEDYDDPAWNHYDEGDSNLPACERPDFVMDCDYDETAPKKKKYTAPQTDKKKKKSPFYTAVACDKPVFDPLEKTYDEYLEEYYAMDFEDLIGEMPCRFKYRKVPANDFGLTTKDILSADTRTLNSWCSMKRVVGWRSKGEEDELARRFQKKARYKKNQHFLKWMQAPSKDPEENNLEKTDDGKKLPTNRKQLKRKADREKRLQMLTDDGVRSNQPDASTNTSTRNGVTTNNAIDKFKKAEKRRTKTRRNQQRESNNNILLSRKRLAAYGLS